MQNELFTVTKYIIDTFSDVPIVNTVSFEKTNDIDFNKENIYPLVNVDLVDSLPIGEVIVFNYTINILQQRDIDNELNNNKTLNKDNLIDNLNECYSIATRVINHMNANFNDHGIEVASQSNIRMVRNAYANKLDGVAFELSLEIPNTTVC